MPSPLSKPAPSPAPSKPQSGPSRSACGLVLFTPRRPRGLSCPPAEACLPQAGLGEGGPAVRSSKSVGRSFCLPRISYGERSEESAFLFGSGDESATADSSPAFSFVGRAFRHDIPFASSLWGGQAGSGRLAELTCLWQGSAFQARQPPRQNENHKGAPAGAPFIKLSDYFLISRSVISRQGPSLSKGLGRLYNCCWAPQQA